MTAIDKQRPASPNQPRTRLLWLIDSFGPGGAESLVIPFVRRLDRHKYDLVVACQNDGGQNVIADALRASGVRTVALGGRSLRDVAAFRRLLRLIRDERIDLIHAHLTYSAIWSAVASRITRVPSVASLHVAPSATRQLATGIRHRLSTDLRDRLMRFVLSRWSTTVITVSHALRDTYIAQGGVDPRKVRVVHNGIEVSRFAGERSEVRSRLEDEFDIAADLPIVATVAVLRPGKGIEVLLEAIRAVPDAIFLVIGDGPMRDTWTALAASQGVAERVRWAGFRKDVETLLPGCDLLAHPSLDDAFPTVLLEAMAAGLPVVASSVGGIPEIVEPGRTGTLVPPGNASALASAIERLLADADLRKRMSVEARAVAAQRFSTEAWMARLEAVYEDALQAAGSGG